MPLPEVPSWKQYKPCIEWMERKVPGQAVEVKKVAKLLQVLYSMSKLCQYQGTGELLTKLAELKKELDKVVGRGSIKAVHEDKTFSDQVDALTSQLRKLKTHLSKFRTRRYDSVVCVGFLVGVPGYGKMTPGEYHGYDDDVTDIDARWAVLQDAIEAAYLGYQGELGNKMPMATDDKKVLKIFMAPEFYFRGKRGAYDVGAMAYLCEKARAVTQENRFADWLFVLGSCVCAATEYQTTGDKITKKDIRTDQSTGKYTVTKPGNWAQQESAGIVLLDNYAIVQKGGIPWGEFGAGDRVVLKQMRSGIDFDYQTQKDVTSPVHLKKAGAVAMTSTGPGAAKYTVGTALDGHYTMVDKATDKTDERGPLGCIFDIDGITFGLEVCLDHYDRRLADSPNDKSAIRVQLIPSWGAEIVDANAINSGIIFNVDGQDWLYGQMGCRVSYYPTGPTTFTAGPQPKKFHVAGPQAAGDVLDGDKTWILYYGPFPIPQ
jgi:hypothetical protein